MCNQKIDSGEVLWLRESESVKPGFKGVAVRVKEHHENWNPSLSGCVEIELIDTGRLMICHATSLERRDDDGKYNFPLIR